MSEGIKHDQEKVRLDLLSPQWITGVGQVLTFGAKKYAAHNWRKGIERSRLLGACLRHILAYLGGEDCDPETGLLHLYHASCCLMFASELHITHPELDDRWKGAKSESDSSDKITSGPPCSHSCVLVPLGGNLDSHLARCADCGIPYRSRAGIKGMHD